MRTTPHDHYYCHECGIETQILAGATAAVDSGQTLCCRSCGSELTLPCEDDAVVAVLAGATRAALERGRH